MAVVEKTKNALWALSAGRCAICKAKLLEESKKRDYSLIGEVAHIVAQKKNGPRGKHSLPLNKRDLIENLILLCRKHHKIIDDQEEEYPVEHLTTIRKDHNDWVSERLNDPQKWECNLSQLNYINVPRVSLLSARLGYEIDLDEFGEYQTLYSLRWGLNKLMSRFLSVLNKISLRAVDFNDINFPDDRLIGATCAINSKFRTKNVPVLGRDEQDSIVFVGDLTKDPHIYKKYDNFKLVMRIQPAWITTSTAFMCFRPSGGVSHFSGLVTISEVDVNNSIVYATPLVLGLPVSDFERAFAEQPIHRELDAVGDGDKNISPGKYADIIDIEKAVDHGIKCIGAPDSCDICKISIENEEFLIDGDVKSSSGWAYMCSHCFDKYGVGIGYGIGQLFKKTKNDEWLLVGGFPPERAYDFDV